MERTAALELDAQDPLREFKNRFVITDPDTCYLDGNSLQSAHGLIAKPSLLMRQIFLPIDTSCRALPISSV